MDFVLEPKITLTEDRVANLLVNACEGGSNYWIEWADTYPYQDDPTPDNQWQMKLRLPIDFKADGDDTIYTLTRENLQEALLLMIEKYPFHWSSIIEENDDADTGDALLQLALFKEIVYG